MTRGVLWFAAAALVVLAVALSLRQPAREQARAGPETARPVERTDSGAVPLRPSGAAPGTAPHAPGASPAFRNAGPGGIPLRPAAPGRPDPHDRGGADLLPPPRDWFRSPPGRGDSPRIHRAWDEHIAPLVYARNHPRAGEFRDGVTLDQAVEGRVGFEAETLPDDYLDAPLREVTKRISPHRVMERTRTWDRKDVESSRAFMQWLLDQPDEIHGPEATFEIRTYPDDPEAYTRRERIAARIRDDLAPLFAEE